MAKLCWQGTTVDIHERACEPGCSLLYTAALYCMVGVLAASPVETELIS